MINSVLFIGTSISIKEVRTLVDTDKILIKPPIQREDLENLGSAYKNIYIVDGVFHTELSISPREILNKLKQGYKVYGGSSMGALRAAELDLYGMIGIGSIYEMYKSGEINSDAEVALSCNPENYYPLSEPLINIRYAIKLAYEKHLIKSNHQENMLKALLKVHFYELNYAEVFKTAKKIWPPNIAQLFQEFIKKNKKDLDLKRKDALKVIRVINRNNKKVI
jgi:hypothetical protein